MEFNWISIIIAALAAMVLYLVKKTLNMKKTISKLEEELEITKLANIQYIESAKTVNCTRPQAAYKPAPQQKNSPIPLKNVNIQKAPVPSANKVYSIEKEKPKSEESESESYSDSESEYDDDDTSSESSESSMSEDYINNDNEIEKYGNDKKEMIIPININSLLQRAIEEHMNKDAPDTNVKISEVVEEEKKAVGEEKKLPEEVEEDRVSDMFRNTVETDEVKSEGSEKQVQAASNSAEQLRQELQAKNILAIKNMAKEIDIKITEGGKPKNKETLIAEIISKTYQNI